MTEQTAKPVGPSSSGEGSPSKPSRSVARRLAREQRTVESMIRLYCRAHHPRAAPAVRAAEEGGVCPACGSLIAYSRRRVEECRFGPDKPVCTDCRVHCFRSDMREQVRIVMRYSGPRMAYRHPYLATMHLLDRRRSRERG